MNILLSIEAFHLQENVFFKTKKKLQENVIAIWQAFCL
jgi:hypothetical protein